MRSGGGLDFGLLLQILGIPNASLIFMLGAFFDESGTDGKGSKKSPHAVVAGHLYIAENAAKLDQTIRLQLGIAGLKYFRASEAAHGIGELAKITKEARVVLYGQLIQAANRYRSWSISVAIDKRGFESWSSIDSREVFKDPYCLAFFACIALISQKAHELALPGPIQYVFEDGHVTQGHANIIMTEVVKDKDRFMYGGHSFQSKVKCRPLYPSDILAWESRKRLADGDSRRPRESYNELSRHRCDHYLYDAGTVRHLLDIASQKRTEFMARGIEKG